MDKSKCLDFSLDGETNLDIKHLQDKTVQQNVDNRNKLYPTVAQNKT